MGLYILTSGMTVFADGSREGSGVREASFGM